MNAKDLTLALRGRWQGSYGVACCPSHEDRSPSLSIADGNNGTLLLKCHAGCSYPTIRSELDRMGYLTSYPSLGSARTRAYRYARKFEGDGQDRERRSKVAQRLWRLSIRIKGSKAETYLRERGITASLPYTLRYIGGGRHPSGETMPVMLGKVSGGEGFGVHRTFLSQDGKGKTALVPSKAMLGPTKGGAVQLSDCSGPLTVTEGIETGLSLLSGLLSGPSSVWAALSAGGMEALRLPSEPGDLVVAPDGDDRGIAAAHNLASRAHGLGWRVSFLIPPEGRDWNDVLCNEEVRA